MTEVTSIKTVASRLRRMARSPNDFPQSVTVQSNDSPHLTRPKPKSKQDMILDLLRREGGALLTDLVEATGWLPHTARAALTGLKKKGYAIIGTKVDKATRYSIASE